jgi:two-component system sensor histidine kinase and response regulator WspE
MSGGFGDIPLLDLFKLEAESHCAALSNGLLALEKSPGDRSIVEPLMRAAHSIKGAARIVGLDRLVTLAHAMEECFLAARDGREALTTARVNQLLEAVDLLGEVRALAEADLAAWTESRAGRVAELVARLKAPPPAEAAPPVPVPTPPPESIAAAAPTAAPATGGPASVRVAADTLNRILFLAGESTVEAARLQSLRGLLPASAEESPRLDAAFRRVEELTGTLYTEVLRSRLRPFAEGVTAFPRMVRDIAQQLGRKVALRIEGEGVEVDRDILQKLESPLTHMIRNSLDHGVEPPADREAAGKPAEATITLSARHQSGMLVVEVRDDGRGIAPEVVRRRVIERGMVAADTAQQLDRAELMDFLFLPGFSTRQATSELSGRGVGLDVVRTMVQEVSGTVALDSEPGRGARFTLRLPVTRSVIRAAVVRIGAQLFAVPLARLEHIALVPGEDVEPVQGRMQVSLENRPVGLVHAAQVLGAGSDAALPDPAPVLVIGSGDDRCGLVVDEVRGEEDLVVRPLDARLGAVPHLAAAAIRSDGVPVLVVNVDDLWRSVKQALQGGRPLGIPAAPGAERPDRRRILVVDDSITVREVERQLLLRRGYDVDVAVDGREGYNALRAGRYDLMITDVDMPRMTGIELIRAVRREPRLAGLPIIIVSYKDREEDRLLGLEAGASAYLTKSSFQDDSLIRMVEDLVGAPA